MLVKILIVFVVILLFNETYRVGYKDGYDDCIDGITNKISLLKDAFMQFTKESKKEESSEADKDI